MAGVVLGVALLATGVGRDGPGGWGAVAPPLAVLLLGLVRVAVRSRRHHAAVTRSRQLLVDGRTTVPVTLRAEWGGTAAKVRNRIGVRRSDTGEVVGFVRVASPDGPFDPRGELRAHGTLCYGEIVTFDADDGRAPLLSVAPMEGLDREPFVSHPCSVAINGLLGWDRSPGEAVVLPPDLAAAASPTVARHRRGALVGLTAVLVLPVTCLVLQPAVAVAMVLTAVVWASWLSWLRWGAMWSLRPTVAALERAGFAPADARYVARALVGTSFGLGAPPELHAPATPAAEVPPAPAPARWSVGTIALLVGLVFVTVGALLYASSASASSRTVPVEAMVIESPSASGGVVLAVPMGVPTDGVIMRQVVPWEAELDPDGVRVGDHVTVHLDPACICDPSLDDGTGGAGRQGIAFGLIGLGVAVAVGGRVVGRRSVRSD